jgi:hypothetical protein
MAKQAVNKTQVVRDYLNAHPGAVPSQITAALNEQGIQITPGHVARIKTKIDNPAKKAATDSAVPPVVKKLAETLTPNQVKSLAQAIKRIRSGWKTTGTSP